MRSMADSAIATPDAYQLALKYLARRDHIVFELRQKLNHKGCDAAAIEQAVEQLKTQYYLSDERFAMMLIHSKVSRGQGPVKIRYELQQHRIDPALIETSLADCEVDWFDVAQQVYHKHFGHKPIKDFAGKQKRQRFLYQRGFDNEMIRAVIEA